MSADIMRSEILEQPSVCARLLTREEAGLVKVIARLKKKKPVGIVLAARGSSDHAAVYARYLLEYLTGIPTHLAAPSLVTMYKVKPDFRNYLVIGVSQSGQGPDINAVVAEATRQGAMTIGVTNDPKSGLALLGALWKNDRAYTRQLWQIPQQMKELLQQTEAGVEDVAGRLKKLNACVVLGRGFQMGVAHEMGLKMKECASVPALSYSTADFAHGPVSLAQKGFPVFLVSAPGKLESENLESTLDLIKRGAAVYRVGLRDKNFAKLKASPRLNLQMCGDASTDETLSPMLTILPGQWFAYHNALAKGLNPAMPKGLKKVTKTK